VCAWSAASTFCPTATITCPRGVEESCAHGPSGPIWRWPRSAREALVAAIETGREPVSPRLRFDTVADWWIERFETRVAAGERHPRTLESHRYHLECHLLPVLASKRLSALTVDDVAALLDRLCGKGCSAKTAAGALATLHSVVRYARRHSWIALDPIDKLEADERPRPAQRRQRVLGRDEIERLLAACPTRDRLMVGTALYTGLRISDLLGLIWSDSTLPRASSTCVRSSRAPIAASHLGAWRRRPSPRSGTSHLSPSSQGSSPLTSSRRRSRPGSTGSFATSHGTPHGHRNVSRRCLTRAAECAGLNDGGWPPLRFHDLRHAFASHLIVDLGLDVAQVSRILGHASPTITLNVYTHMFDDARHAREIRQRMAASPFAELLNAAPSGTPTATVVQLR